MFSQQKEMIIIWCGGRIRSAMVVIILQYANVSYEHVVHLELKQCYMSSIFQ